MVSVEPGSFWQVGRHLLYCGDGSLMESYRLAFGGKRAAMCITDPPYGMSGEPPAEKTLAFFSVVPCSTVALTFPVDLHFHRLANATRGWNLRRELCWIRREPGILSRGYRQQHVPVLIFTRGEGGTWDVPDTHGTVMLYSKPSDGGLRPIGLWKRLIENHSRRGDVILDPFAGVGTTIFAADGLDRRVVAIESDPARCASILRRAVRRGLGYRPIED